MWKRTADILYHHWVLNKQALKAFGVSPLNHFCSEVSQVTCCLAKIFKSPMTVNPDQCSRYQSSTLHDLWMSCRVSEYWQFCPCLSAGVEDQLEVAYENNALYNDDCKPQA